MKLRIMNPEELKRAYETDLVEAFPPAELKPLSAMERMRFTSAAHSSVCVPLRPTSTRTD